MGDSRRATALRSPRNTSDLMRRLLELIPAPAIATQSDPTESDGDNNRQTNSRSRVGYSDYGIAHNLARSDTIQSDNLSTPARHAELVSIQNSTEPDEDRAHVTQSENTAASKPSAAQETDLVAKEVDSTVSLPRETTTLRDEAYESLKSQKAELLQRYEILLTDFLQGISKGEQRRRNSESGALDSIIASSNPLRKQQMNSIINSFLSRYQDKDSNSDTEKSASCRQIAEILASVICYSPDAVLPWAATCLSAQARADDSLRSKRVAKGVGHIISRMAWYTILPKLLDGNRDDDLNEEYQTHNRWLLKNKILELYKQILLYQIRIACSEKNDFLEESSFERDASSASAVGYLDEAEILLAETALTKFQDQDIEEKIRTVMESNSIEMVRASCDEEFAMEKAEVQNLLEDLNEIYPFEKRLAVDDKQSETLNRLYRWVCSTPEYSQFRDATGGALWVSCSPTTGTAMIMQAITYGLSNQRAGNQKLECTLLSFGERHLYRPENSMAVIKRLISLLLEQQPWLVNHLAEKCESTKRKHFSDREDFYALSLVLFSMLQDDRFNPTLFLLDGIDEIDNIDDHRLDSLTTLIFTTMTLSNKVKWLVSIDSTYTIDASHLNNTDKSLCLALDLGSQQAVDAFEKSYIPSKVSDLCKNNRYNQSFYASIEEKLRQAACRDFLRADIACEAVKLDDIWHASDFLEQLSKQPHTSTDPLFKFMKSRIEKLPGKEPEFCQKILFTLTGTYRPLRINELEALVGLPPEVDIKVLIEKRCFAFLEICGEVVHFRNRLARGFLKADMKGLHPNQHAQMLELCLDCLSRLFKTSSSKSHSQRHDGLTKPTNYATVYWVKHLHDTGDIGVIKKKVESFLAENLLNWLDLLVESGWRSQVWAMTRELQTHQESNPDMQAMGKSDDSDDSARDFLTRIREAQELIRLHDLTETPNKISIRNTLLFSPDTSLIRRDFLPGEIPQIAVPPVTKQSWRRIAHILQGHTDYVRCCAYSHDGKYLASGSDDQTVRIWNTTTGKVQHVFQGFRGWVYTVGFSCKGLIAATDAATIKVWDVATGALQMSLDDGPLTADTINDLTFSPDGTMLAAVVGRDIFIMSLPSYSIVVQKNVGYCFQRVRRVRFSKGNTLLGTLSGSCVSIWELGSTTGSKAETRTDTEADAEIDPNIEAGANRAIKKIISGQTEFPEGKDQELQLKHRKNLEVAKDTTEWAVGLSFSHDSKFVATGTDERNLVYIWEWQLEEDPCILKGHMSQVAAVSFSRDAKYVASASEDKTSRVWEAPWEGNDKSATLTLSGNSRIFWDASFSPSQNSLATCSSDGNIWIWDYDGPKESRDQKPADEEAIGNQPISIVAISNYGELIASASSQGIICLWDGESGKLRRKFTGHERDVESLTFSSDSKRIVSASDDCTARVWDAQDGIELYKLIGHGDWVRAAVFSPDGNLVASGSDDRTVRIWDIRDTSGETNSLDSLTLEGHTAYATAVAFSQDGKSVASGGDDGRVLVWQLEKGDSKASPKLKAMDGIQESRIMAVAFMEDSEKLIASLSRRICIWNSKTGDHIGEVSTNYTFRTLQLAIEYPQYLMTDLGPLRLENILELHKAEVTPTSWSPYGFTSDSQWITWMDIKTIYLPERYRTANGQLSARAWGHKVIIGCYSGQLLLFSFKEAAVFTSPI